MVEEPIADKRKPIYKPPYIEVIDVDTEVCVGVELSPMFEKKGPDGATDWTKTNPDGEKDGGDFDDPYEAKSLWSGESWASTSLDQWESQMWH